VASLLTGLADRAVADVGKLRVLTPAERMARLEQLLPRYQTPWLLPVAGPASVSEAAEAYNYALWTLVSPEWQPELVVAVEVKKFDERIDPKQNPAICRPEGGGVEVHFEHRGHSVATIAKADMPLVLRIEDASCDPTTGTGESHAAVYWSQGTIMLGRASFTAASV
jgi:hypothetical protein